MQLIEATFFVECGIPVRKDGIDGVNLKFSRPMPFVPNPGFYICVMEADDFREVEQVYWSDKDGLHIFLKYQPNAKVKWMKSLGWVSAD